MVGGHLVVAVGDQQQRPGALHPPPQEHQQVQGRLVRPVGVLHHDHLTRGRPVQLVEERGEDVLARASRRQQLGQPAAGLAGDVVQRAERARRQQRVAGTHQEACLRRVPFGEPPDQRRLADARLARHQGDAAARGRRGQQTAQLAQRGGTLEQVHGDAVRYLLPRQRGSVVGRSSG
jgi:hypothetical protein